MKHKDWDISNGTKPNEVGLSGVLCLPSAICIVVTVS